MCAAGRAASCSSPASVLRESRCQGVHAEPCAQNRRRAQRAVQEVGPTAASGAAQPGGRRGSPVLLPFTAADVFKASLFLVLNQYFRSGFVLNV